MLLIERFLQPGNAIWLAFGGLALILVLLWFLIRVVIFLFFAERAGTRIAFRHKDLQGQLGIAEPKLFGRRSGF